MNILQRRPREQALLGETSSKSTSAVHLVGKSAPARGLSCDLMASAATA